MRQRDDSKNRAYRTVKSRLKKNTAIHELGQTPANTPRFYVALFACLIAAHRLRAASAIRFRPAALMVLFFGVLASCLVAEEVWRSRPRLSTRHNVSVALLASFGAWRQ